MGLDIDSTKSYGRLKDMSVYLCGAMEHNYSDGATWRINLGSQLRNRFDLNVYDPYKKIGGVDEQTFALKSQEFRKQKNLVECKRLGKQVVQKDLRMLDKSDFVICNWMPDIPTYGSTDEVCHASRVLKRPVLIHCSDITKLPMWIIWITEPSLIFEKWVTLFDYLDQINNLPLEEIDTLDRWVFC